MMNFFVLENLLLFLNRFEPVLESIKVTEDSATLFFSSELKYEWTQVCLVAAGFDIISSPPLEPQFLQGPYDSSGFPKPNQVSSVQGLFLTINLKG